MTLSSGISKRFKQPFVLDDDGLRRIEGVLTKAASTYIEPLAVTYHAQREDDRFYETHDIDEVLADPNVKHRRIRLLGIELRKKSSLNTDDPKDGDRVAWIVFDKDQPPIPDPDVRIRIRSPEKTWALMLADDLEPQVIRLHRSKGFPTWILFTFAPILGLIFYKISFTLGTTGPRLFLHFGFGVMAYMIGLATIALFNGVKHDHFVVSKFLAPEYVFLWGDELTSFAERESLRKNLFWVVLVGFFVSLFAGVATLLI